MLDVVVDPAEQEVVQPRAADVAGHGELLLEERERFARLDHPRAEVVDEENDPQIGPDQERHQRIVEERRRNAEHERRHDEPQHEVKRQKQVDSRRARVADQERDAVDLQREALQPDEDPDQHRPGAA